MKNLANRQSYKRVRIFVYSIGLVLSLSGMVFLSIFLYNQLGSAQEVKRSGQKPNIIKIVKNENKFSKIATIPDNPSDGLEVPPKKAEKNNVVDFAGKFPEKGNHQEKEGIKIVKAADIPPGKFRDQLVKLPRLIQQIALKNLGRLHDYKKDIASINVDANGMIYYTCKFDIDPALEAAALAEENAPDPNPALVSVPISSPPVRHSKPGASKVLFLDFNGGIVSGTAWNTSVAAYDCKPYDLDGDDTTFSDSEQTKIIEFWAMVAEDFAPFDVDVTTEAPAVWNNQTGWAMITEGTDKNGRACPHNGYGGIAYVNVFGGGSYGYYSPAWIMEYSHTYVAEAISHELGHNLGLSHDGQSPGDGEYYRGHNNGVIYWNAIMGGGTYPDVSQWSKGEYYNANRTQNDLGIIAGKLSYRPDDHGDTNGTASALNITGAAVADSGIVETTDDPDVFVFSTGAGTITLNADAYKNSSNPRWGSNLDINLELYNSIGGLVASNNPVNDVDASITTAVAAGTYYLHVKPAGVGNPTNSTPTGYTSYGSLGQYTLSGTVVPVNDIIVLTPNIAEVVFPSETFEITWVAGIAGNVKIELWKGGVFDSTIVADTANDGSFTWNIPGGQAVGNDYKVKIISIDNPAIDDESDSDFGVGTIIDRETFEADMGGWANAAGDDLDWIRDSNGTSSSGTGPSSGYEGSTWYMYVEGSLPNYPDKTAYLQQTFDFTNYVTPAIQFAYHMYGQYMGTLFVDVSTNGGANWTTFKSISGDQGDAWHTTNVDLSAYKETANVLIRFRGRTGTGYTSDIAIDYVTVYATKLASGLTISDVAVTEGNAGTVNAVFDVTLKGVSVFPVTVDYATVDNTAEDENNDGDYQSQSNTLTFNANGTQQVTVLVNGDTRDEDDETFFVNLSNVSGTTINDSSGVCTITDNDPMPTVSLTINNNPISENGGSAAITATLSAISGKDVTVTLSYSGTASGSDYNAGSQILIPAGSPSANIALTTDDDAIDEFDETIIVDISGVTNGTEDGVQQVQTTITDDDLPPTVILSKNTANIAEGSGSATLTATLSGASGKTVTVNLAYSGTATGGGTDYIASGNQIVIAPGATGGNVTVTAVQDALDEVDETIIVDISSVSNGTEDGTQQQTATIIDDDLPPTISINDVTVTEGDAGTINARFTVSLSAVSSKTITVNYTTADSSATTAESDYGLNAATLTFNPGDPAKNIDVTVNGDFNDENDEEFTVDLSAPANATLAVSQGIGTIIDDDDSYQVTVNQGTGDGLYVDGVTVTITADAAPTGLTFDKWIGSVAFANANATTTTFTMPAADTTVRADYIVDPAAAEKLTYGSVLTIYAADVSGMDNEFTSRPTVYGKYTDPVRLREYNGTTRGITAVSKMSPSDKYQCEWNRKVVLYNKTDLRNANRSGTSTADWLTVNPIVNLTSILWARARTAAGSSLDVSVRGTLIVPPEISSIERWDGGDPSGGIHSSSILVVKGNFFGSRAPLVSLEYADPRTGAMRLQRLKVLSEKDYDDYRGKANKSNMNLTSGTGESRIEVEMPKKWWKDWAVGNYDLILDNGVGLDTVSVATVASGTNSNPTAQNDTFSLRYGEVMYYLDVLADNGNGVDADAESDKMTIILGSTTSTLGGRLSVFNGKVKYSPPRNVPVGNFPDTFTYSLSDGHGGTSNSATVTVNMPGITLDPVKHWDGTALGARTVQPGSRVILSGSNFGTKVPTVTMAVENGKTLKLRVVSKAQYADYRGIANRSYTDLTTGNSEITVELPKTFWAGYTNSKAYTITVSNKLDTTGDNADITTSAWNSAPVVNNDAVTLYSGSAYYLIDVLADNGNGEDEDTESDKMTIILPSRTSNLGARLSVDPITNQVRYYRAKDQLCNFIDTFTYQLRDPDGVTSGTSTVTVTGSLNP